MVRLGTEPLISGTNETEKLPITYSIPKIAPREFAGLFCRERANGRLRPMRRPFSRGDVAQLGERRLCKAEVVGSIPIVSTRFEPAVSMGL